MSDARSFVMSTSILVVDDDADTADLLRDVLFRQGYEADVATSAEACLASLRARPATSWSPTFNMGDVSGIELCRHIRAEFPGTTPILVTGEVALQPAVAAIQAGTYDYLTKPVKADVLDVAVARAAEHVALEREVRRLREEVPRSTEGIAGSSQGIVEVRSLVERVAGTARPY